MKKFILTALTALIMAAGTSCAMYDNIESGIKGEIESRRLSKITVMSDIEGEDKILEGIEKDVESRRDEELASSIGYAYGREIEGQKVNYIYTLDGNKDIIDCAYEYYNGVDEFSEEFDKTQADAIRWRWSNN